jgi:mono/diheme cytochrome c family protein
VRAIPKTLGVTIAALLCSSSACVDQSHDVATGAILYERHCASCHGMEGRGDGPVAASLRTAPADLTQLAARSGGRFDESGAMSTIDGRRHVAEHGPRAMPVWGAVFEGERREARQSFPAYTALLDERALVDHLRSLQAAPAEQTRPTP